MFKIIILFLIQLSIFAQTIPESANTKKYVDDVRIKMVSFNHFTKNTKVHL